MIISLRGTSGSGKTFAVRALMALGEISVIDSVVGVRRTKPLVYRVDAGVPPLYVLGSYETTCGGCDTINDYKTVVPELLSRHAHQGHVLFEGLLLSGTYGRVGARMVELVTQGHEAVCVFLDTPLDVCIARINERRAARGDDRPLNTDNTVQKFNQTRRAKELLVEHGLRVVDIDHRDPLRGLLTLLAGAKPLL